ERGTQRLDIDQAIRRLLRYRLERRYRLAELHALAGVGDRPLERFAAHAELQRAEAGCDARDEPIERLLAERGRRWQLQIVDHQVGGGFVVRQSAADALDASLRRIHGEQPYALGGLCRQYRERGLLGLRYGDGAAVQTPAGVSLPRVQGQSATLLQALQAQRRETGCIGQLGHARSALREFRERRHGKLVRPQRRRSEPPALTLEHGAQFGHAERAASQVLGQDQRRKTALAQRLP